MHDPHGADPQIPQPAVDQSRDRDPADLFGDPDQWDGVDEGDSGTADPPDLDDRGD